MNRFLKGAVFYLLLFIIIIGIVQFSGTKTTQVEELEFSKVYKYLTEENISRIHFVEGTSVTGKIKDSNKEFTSYIPNEVLGDKLANEILNQAAENKLVIDGEAQPQTPWFVSMLPTVLLIGFMIIIWFIFMNQSQGGGGKVMSFGKSRARVHKDDEKTRVTFKDVAGLTEEKEDLREVVDFLKNPKRYINLGARIPKGILMVGPPGTGKTYLSRAVAGEAGVPFFSISGSDFVEMFVGVGASRVRDLFEQAKKNSPSLIFIDEIDAVGRQRGAGLGGGHDEREQTLNQLLVEMDGFGANEGIIMIAATNRPDILDPALLRPGRFDRQIMVGRPDRKGREAVLEVHTKKKPLDTNVSLEVLAKRTPGFSGADLENLANEAALLAVRKNKKKIGMDEFEEAITRVIAGPEKKSRTISEHDRKLTAYHEAGHAVVMKCLKNSDPVHEISIIPRGMAGGYTMHLPTEDRAYTSKEKLLDEMVGLLGGRVAEKLILGDISTGAKNDIDRASSIARAMVMEYGMSDKIGTISYGSDNNEVFLGRDLGRGRNFSEEVGAMIDKEIKSLISNAYNTAEELLKENVNKLHAVASTLLEKEKIDGKEFEEIFEAN